jgi:predicted NBD/HSP70 family sugar kinase
MTGTPGSQSALRAANEQRLLDALARAGACTQAQLSRSTGLSAATVSNIVRHLAATGVVDLASTVSSGRRAQSVTLGRRAGLVAGLDFGSSHVRVAVAARSREVLAEREVAVPARAPVEAGIRTACTLLDELLAAVGADRADLVGLGVGVPAPVDAATGRVGPGSTLPDWVGAPLTQLLSRHVDVPAWVDNDANLGALAEQAGGAAAGVADAIYIQLAGAIGAGLVLDGRLFRGSGGTAGEIGHTTVDEHGPVCRCGNRGCLETVAATPVVLRLLRPTHGDLAVDDVVRLAAAGDVPCRRVVEDVGRQLGTAVANLVNLLNPRVVVVGGDWAPLGDLLLDPVRATVRRNAVPSAAGFVRVVPSALGRRAQVLGALALVLAQTAGATPGAQDPTHDRP